MPKFREKTEPIEAFQLTQEMVEAYLFDDVQLPGCLKITKASYNSIHRTSHNVKIAIKTLTGFIPVDVGDWIVKHGEGEPYPCKSDIFKATYELAD